MAASPPEVVLYTRVGCRLCTHAHDALSRLGRELPLDLRIVDIDEDPVLVARYGEAAPVVAVDGVEVSSGRIDTAAVRRALVAAREA